MVQRFFKDIKKYYAYFVRAGRAELKSEVAFSHLSWLWWVLDPLLFMLVYTFVSVIVFGKSEPYLAAFIFIGHNTFTFFQNTVKGSVKLVSGNKSIVKNVYIPKPMLLFTKLYVNLFKFGISFLLVFIAMALYKVPLTAKILYFIPEVFLLILLSVSIGMILMHFGVYVEDLANIVNVVLRLAFYLSGVFYNIETRVEEGFLKTLLLKCNPIAFLINQMRRSLLYGQSLSYKVYIAWLFVSLVILIIGVKIVYKNENGYAKVI